MNNFPQKLLFPFENLPFTGRLFLSLLPTILVLCGYSSLPFIAQQTPAAFFYPAVFLASWTGGAIPGVVSTLTCTFFSLFYLRPHLLVSPFSDVPSLVRCCIFLSTSLLFLSLISLLQRALSKAKEAIAIREDFISMASHELRNPLTALKLKHDIVRRMDDLPETAVYRDLLEVSERQIGRLERLISTMMDAAMFDSNQILLRKTHCDLNKILQEVSESIKALPLKGEVQLVFSSQAWGYFDPLRVEQVVFNLLHNALKYGNNKPIIVCSGSENGHVWFSVTDQGEGIAKKDQLQIFHKFHRAKSSDKIQGIGLGLYLSQKLIELHEGQISLESEMQKGSTFLVKIPT